MSLHTQNTSEQRTLEERFDALSQNRKGAIAAAGGVVALLSSGPFTTGLEQYRYYGQRRAQIDCTAAQACPALYDKQAQAAVQTSNGFVGFAVGMYIAYKAIYSIIKEKTRS